MSLDDFQLGTELGYAQTVRLQLSKVMHSVSISRNVAQAWQGKSATKDPEQQYLSVDNC